MAIVTLNWNEEPLASCRGGALTIGNFDGVHRGHAALVAEARRQARLLDGPVVALTFDPHPLRILQPDRFQPTLTTAADRAELLQAAGADHVVLLRTTPELLQLTADRFFSEVVLRSLGARAMVEGGNFGFGRGRGGNVETLRTLCTQSQISFVVVPPYHIDGVAVSTSRVKHALLRGAVREAARAARPGAALFVFTFSRHTLPDELAPVAGETFVFTQFSGAPQCFLSETQLHDELRAAGFAPDSALPMRELNRPAPGLRAGGPVIYEGAFRFS